MVYCDLIERKANSAIYAFGTQIGNVTGEAEFYAGYKTPSIIRQPDGENISLQKLMRVVGIHYRNFEKGVFPEKISYER